MVTKPAAAAGENVDFYLVMWDISRPPISWIEEGKEIYLPVSSYLLFFIVQSSPHGMSLSLRFADGG